MQKDKMCVFFETVSLLKTSGLTVCQKEASGGGSGGGVVVGVLCCSERNKCML